MLTKRPEPVPSEVLTLATVGLPLEFQQTPLEEISAPPSLIILPPEKTDVSVILAISVVVRTGISSFLHETKKHERMKNIIMKR
jgi:hypothetical protein